MYWHDLHEAVRCQRMAAFCFACIDKGKSKVYKEAMQRQVANYAAMARYHMGLSV